MRGPATSKRTTVKLQVPNNEKDLKPAHTGGCSVCESLLGNLKRFFTMLETARRPDSSEWLTVDEIAKELKVSRSIVYRLIRNGELEAVDIVVPEKNGETAKKGHYRIKRSALDHYLEAKRVKPSPNQPDRLPPQRFPRVKNHLGL